MSKKVTAKQLKAIYMLIEGKTGGEISAALKLRRETLSRWKHLSHFQHKFSQVMQDTEEAMQRRLGRLADYSIAAIIKDLGYNPYESKRIEVALKVLDKLGIACKNIPQMTKHADNARKDS